MGKIIAFLWVFWLAACTTQTPGLVELPVARTAQPAQTATPRPAGKLILIEFFAIT